MYSRRPMKKILEKEFTDSLGSHRAFGAEAARLLVYLENKERIIRAEPALNCCVVESGSNTQFSNILQDLVSLSPQIERTTRMQFLVKQGGHYTAVDMKLSPEGHEFIVLDSAGDPRYMAHYMKLSALINKDGSRPFFSKGYIVVGLSPDGSDILQEDCYSCPMFAFDFVRQLSRMDELYSLVASVANKDGYVSWNNMPPQLVCNAQSFTWLRKYFEINTASLREMIPGTKLTFEEYLKLANGDAGYVSNVQNKAITNLFHELAAKALIAIHQMEENALVHVVESPKITSLSLQFSDGCRLKY